MTDRYSNEIDQLSDVGSKPEPASLERPVDPLITQDYGITDELVILAALRRSGAFAFNITRKVSTDSRYVVEIEVVKRESPGSGSTLPDPEWLPDF